MNETQRIAADVGAAAVRALTPLELLPAHVGLLALGAGDRAELEQSIVWTRDDLAEAVEDLGAQLDDAAGWWLADRPPAFDPGATSAAEAVVRRAARVLAWLDVPGLEDLTARCRLATLKLPRFDPNAEGRIEAALVCEVATMGRRDDRPGDLKALWAAVYPDAGLRSRKDILSAARGAATRELPDGWRGMTQAQRAALVDVMWKTAQPGQAEAMRRKQEARRRPGRPTLAETNPALVARVLALFGEGKTPTPIVELLRPEFPDEDLTPDRIRGIRRSAQGRSERDTPE
jgi:hypothetical protein